MRTRVRGVAVIIGMAAVLAPVQAQAVSLHAREGARYIASQQTSTGAFFSENYPADAQGEALMALATGGVSGASVDAALRYLAKTGPARADERAAYAARIVMGLVAVGRDPTSFGGVDYLSKITSRYDAVTGRYDPQNLYSDALAMLGVLAGGGTLPEHSLRFLRANACTDGGFGHEQACAGGPDVDTTAIVLDVLISSGAPATDAARSGARAWLIKQQNDDAGFGANKRGEATNANSTGLAATAMTASGEQWRVAGGATPSSALEALQMSNGGFRYSAAESDADGYATVQAVIGIGGGTYPPRAPSVTAAGGAPTQSPTSKTRTVASGSTTTQPSPSTTAASTAEHRAGLVVQTSDGAIRTHCVRFREATISGYELLRRSAEPLIVQDFGNGSFVCKIGDEGRDYPRESCTPPCPDTDSCTYWGYYRIDLGTTRWRFSELGAIDSVVSDGDIEGWHYGTHSLKGGSEPSTRPTLDDICAARTALAPVARSEPSDERGTKPWLFVLILAVLAVPGWMAVKRMRSGA
jgi:hypothetical protein